MIGQVCHHFGFSYKETLWEIDWAVIQRMLIDAPGYESEEDIKKSKPISEQSSTDLLAAFQKAF